MRSSPAQHDLMGVKKRTTLPTAIAGNARVSAGYYDLYYICLRWYFRTNEHVAKAIKTLVTY